MDTGQTVHGPVHFTTTRVTIKFDVLMYDAGICLRFQIAPHACPCVIEKLSTIQC